MYDLIIVTHIPAFYKVNLYNELAKKLDILVIFIAKSTNEVRANDFLILEKSRFEYKVLFDGDIEDRNIASNIYKLRRILRQHQYKKILIGGWNLKEFWYLVFTNHHSKNYLVLESTINESKIDLMRSTIKKIFLSRISIVFASGSLHRQLLKKLEYKGKVMITKGVGIINKPSLRYIKREYRKKFIYVGRLSKEKNIELLVDLFNDLKDFSLTIIGTGPLENSLKRRAKENIIFKGQVNNQQLKSYFDESNILMLTSISETWGLVVEEALYFGLPVIVSNNCGVCEIINEGINGYIVDINNIEHIKDTILNLNNNIYQKLVDGVEKSSINKKDLEQLGVYFAN